MAPQNGNAFGEEASRKRYIKHRDCCSYVASRKDMGVLRRERLTPEKSRQRHASRLFASKYGTEESLDGDQLLIVVKTHVGYVVTQDHSPRSLVEQVAKVATMPSGRGSAETRVETFILTFESFFVNDPQADALYGTTRSATSPNWRRTFRCRFSRVVLRRGSRGWCNQSSNLSLYGRKTRGRW